MGYHVILSLPHPKPQFGWIPDSESTTRNVWTFLPIIRNEHSTNLLDLTYCTFLS